MGVDEQTKANLGHVTASPESVEGIIPIPDDDPYRGHRMFGLTPIGDPGSLDKPDLRGAAITLALKKEAMRKSIAGAKVYARLLDGLDNGRCTLAQPEDGDDKCEILDPDGIATGFYVELAYAIDRWGITDYRAPDHADPLGDGKPISESEAPVPIVGSGKTISVPESVEVKSVAKDGA